MARRAKIVCTLGPATSSPDRIRELVDAGMDVARLNLSHGTHAEHEAVYRAVRDAADATGRGVAVLVDLQGPKIRLATFAGGPVVLRTGAEFTITADEADGDEHRVSTTYPALPDDVSPGDRLLVDDGKVVLEAVEVSGRDVVTRVRRGGRVSDHKGLNLPDVAVSAPVLTDKDEADLRWALGIGTDLVALSFVRSPDDVRVVHSVMDEAGFRLPVIAKLEKREAMRRLEEVVAAFDGIMVARGDLGVEAPLEQVPLMQKRAIFVAREHAKPVIVATQMLESMISAESPTRAEVSDVANAVLDGADALMLSAETGVGEHPITAVETMARIIASVESEHERPPGLHVRPTTVGGAIAHAAADVADVVGAVAMVGFTQTGDTVRRLARERSEIPLLAFTPVQVVRSRLAPVWGVETFLVDHVEHTDEMVALVDAALLDIGRCQVGDRVVIVAGSPPGTPGSTNAMRVHKIGSGGQDRS